MQTDPNITVELFRYTAGASARQRCAFPLPIWDLLWELGRAFGWRPAGTTYVAPSTSPIESLPRHDYQPGGALDHKCVDEEDAAAWARALDLAKESPHAAAMIDAQSVAFTSGGKPTGELLAEEVDAFIEFARDGAFQFTLSSEGASETARREQESLR